MGLFKRDDKGTKRRTIMARAQSEFRMMIEDIFFIRGVGTIVTGIVESGTCSIGEKAVIVHNSKEIETEITLIEFLEKEHKQENIAYPNEKVGLGIQGITKEQLEQKDIETGDWVIVRKGQAEVM